jgi:hypothetical protein
MNANGKLRRISPASSRDHAAYPLRFFLYNWQTSQEVGCERRGTKIRCRHHIEVVKTAAEQTRNRTSLTRARRTWQSARPTTDRRRRGEGGEEGYDLLFVGIENVRNKSGGFHQDVMQIASAFEGPLAVAIARNPYMNQPQACPLNILVPIIGTDISRRAAEVALAIGRACKCLLTALYVANENSNGARRKTRFRAQRQEEAILKEIVELADRYDYQIRTTVETGIMLTRPSLRWRSSGATI